MGIPKRECKGLGKKGWAGFAREFPQQLPPKPWHVGAGDLGRLGGTGVVWGWVAALAPKRLLSPSARRSGLWLPALDDLCVITADNEIFSHRG